MAGTKTENDATLTNIGPFDIPAANYDGGSLNQVAFGLGFTWP